MKGQGGGGFTLIELMVVMAIIAILAGLFVLPGAMGAGEKARAAAARLNVEALEKAIDFFLVDNEELPNRKDSSTENYYTLLSTGMAADGTATTAVIMADKQGVDKSTAGVLDITDFPLIKRDNLYHHLIINGRSYPVFEPRSQYGWRESYLKLKGTLLDPWGNSYVVALKDQGNGLVRIFILSAGPDKILDTDPATGSTISPDDIGTTWLIRP